MHTLSAGRSLTWDPEDGDADAVRFVVAWDAPEKRSQSWLDKLFCLILLSEFDKNSVTVEGIAVLYDRDLRTLDIVSREQTFSTDGHVEHHGDPEALPDSAVAALRSDLRTAMNARGDAGSQSFLVRLNRLPAHVHHVAIALGSRATDDLPRLGALRCAALDERTGDRLAQVDSVRPDSPHSVRIPVIISRSTGTAWTVTAPDAHAIGRTNTDFAAAITRYLPSAPAHHKGLS